MFKIKFEHLLILLVITLGILSSTIKLNAQPGFNHIYEFPNSSGVSFSNIQSKNDKTILSGNILIDSTNLWSVIICTIDTFGAVIDYHTYSDSNGNNLLFISRTDLIFTSDGGNALVGVVLEGNSSFLLKTDSSGQVKFFKEFTDPTTRAYFLNSVLQTSSGFMIGGSKQELDYSINLFLIKTDTQGNKIWEKTYGLPDTVEFLGCISEMSPNQYAVGTSSHSTLGTDLKNTYARSYIFTIDSLGHVLSEWKSNRNEEVGVTSLHFLKEDSSWVYITRTFEVIDANDPDGWVGRGRVIKRDKNFYPVWDRSIGNPTSYLNFLSCLQEDFNGNWITAGKLVTSSGKPGPPNLLLGTISKLSGSGDSIWRKDLAPLLDSIIGTENYLTGLTILSTGSIIACGYTNVWDASPRSIGWIVKLDANGCLDYLCNTVGENIDNQFSNFKLFPNPATDFISIDYHDNFNIEIFNSNGQFILESKNLYAITKIDISYLQPSVYYLKLQDGEKFIIKKFIKL